MERFLILESGTVFKGQAFGAVNISTIDGEIVFSTAMVGYPEQLTDPSYKNQILVFTYPIIGNYGCPPEDIDDLFLKKYYESDNSHIKGLIVSEYVEEYSHFQGSISINNWLKKHNIPGISGIDTRELT